MISTDVVSSSHNINERKNEKDSEDKLYHSPKFNHSFDITVKKTTQVILTDVGENESYFFPTGIYDWWLTQPNHDKKFNYYTYDYIPGYSDLLFYKDESARNARADFWHFVQPLQGHVQIDNVRFFADDYTSQSSASQAMYGVDTGCLFYCQRDQPEGWSTKVVAEDNGYISNVLFSKNALPRCKEARDENLNYDQTTAIQAGKSFEFDVTFHNPLWGGARFVKPLRNHHAKANQGKYTNFTYLPYKSLYFLKNKPVLSDSTPIPDADQGWNFDGYNMLCIPPKQPHLNNPLHLLWFPEIPKVNATDIKMRVSFMMTTSATFRLFSKFATHNEKAYEGIEAHMGMHYKYGSYEKFEEYAISPSL